MDDLVRWLTAQLDEDQRIARAVHPDPQLSPQDPVEFILAGQDLVTESTEAAEGHIATFADPARVLRDIDAKRLTLLRCEEAMLALSPMLVHFAKQTVRDMAAVYSDRPGYAEALASFE